MKVRDVMTRDVVTVTPETSYKELIDTMLEHEVSGLPVVDADGELVGLVTEADLAAKEAYGARRRRPLRLVAEYLRGRDPAWLQRASGLTADQVMTRVLSKAAPDDDVRSAARRLVELGRKRLPVVDASGELVGIVSRADILRMFDRSDDEIAADVERALRNYLLVPESHTAVASVADGIVRLDGGVEHPSDSRVVEAAMTGIAGVIGVENRLEVRRPEPAAFR